MSLFAVISAVAADVTVAGPSVFSSDHPDEWDDDGDEPDDDHELRVEVVVPPPAAGRGAESDGRTRRQIKADLRDKNAELVRELVRFTPLDHRQVNAELNRLAGIRKVTEATVDDLERRLVRGERWLRSL
jgi:hypothetical protein